MLMPKINFITFSQKITDEKEKERIKKVVEKILPKNSGLIIRTAAKDIEEKLILKDIERLITKWNKIEKIYYEYKEDKPKIIYDNKALIRRTLIDIIDQDLQKVIVNDKKTHKDVSELLSYMNMEEKIKLELKENENLIETYKLKEQLEKANLRKIWLKCGGFISIDRTEALTAIDVNTGKYIGTKNLEKTVYIVNKEATIEIAKQLRLRDIGGIIIIDYIDMQEEENKEKIIQIFNEILKKDRTKIQILGFTKLNLLELTRKNMCNNDEY